MNLCQFGSGCFGCCGDDFKSEQEILKEIKENIQAFESHKDKKEFMKRPPYFKPSGICGNIGFFNGTIGCLVYPEQGDKDIRKDYCDDDFECTTLKEFRSWSKQEQQAFLKFLKEKDLNFYEYSVNMDNGKLLEEFKKGP